MNEQATFVLSFRELDGEAALNQLILGLIEAGYVDDARAAKAYARSRLVRGYGPLQAEAELCARGFDDEISRAVIADEELDWPAAARKVWKKRLAAAMPSADPSSWLGSCGFREEEIEVALCTSAADE